MEHSTKDSELGKNAREFQSTFQIDHLSPDTAVKRTIQFWNGLAGLFVRGMFDWTDTITRLQDYKITRLQNSFSMYNSQ